MYYLSRMNHHQEETIPSTEPLPYELLPTDPTVSVDLKVKRKLPKGASFEVDYPALRETIKVLDGPDDTSNLTIHYRKSVGGFMTRGKYVSDGDDHSVEIRVGRPKGNQRTLQHELTHYIDISKNPTTRQEEIRAAIGGVALYTSTGITGVDLGLSLASLGTHSEYASNFLSADTLTTVNEVLYNSNAAGICGSLGTLAVGVAFYYAHKREIIARKGGRKEAPMVTSTPEIENPSTVEPSRVLRRSRQPRSHQTHHQGLIPIRHAAAHRRLGR